MRVAVHGRTWRLTTIITLLPLGNHSTMCYVMFLNQIAGITGKMTLRVALAPNFCAMRAFCNDAAGSHSPPA